MQAGGVDVVGIEQVQDPGWCAGVKFVPPSDIVVKDAMATQSMPLSTLSSSESPLTEATTSPLVYQIHCDA